MYREYYWNITGTWDWTLSFSFEIFIISFFWHIYIRFRQGNINEFPLHWKKQNKSWFYWENAFYNWSSLRRKNTDRKYFKAISLTWTFLIHFAAKIVWKTLPIFYTDRKRTESFRNIIGKIVPGMNSFRI